MNNIRNIIIAIVVVFILLAIYLVVMFQSVSNTFTVTFDIDGVLETQEVKSGSIVDKPTNPKKDNYTFEYWSYEEKEFDFNTPIIEDITLYATWKNSIIIEKFLVTFDYNNKIENVFIEEGNLVTKPTDPIKEHYTFEYWSYEEKEFDFNTPITKDIKLTAIYVANKYTVTFMNDDEVNEVEIEYNTKISTFPHVEKEGYVFKYWTLDDEQFDVNQVIVGPIILKAEWISLEDIENFYIVTFNDGTTTIEVEVAEGTTVEHPNNPTSDSHNFLYWTLNDQEYNFNNLIDENITLIAKWEIKTFTITFNTNGGDEIESIELEYNSLIPNYAPTKTNSVFSHWQVNEMEYDFNTPVTSNITLVAIWDLEEFTIIFSSPYSTTEKQYIQYNGYIIEPEKPTNEYRDFLYWTYNNEKYDFNTPVTKSIVLIAVWSDVFYTVTFNSNGGSEVEPQIVQEGQAITNPEKPVRENYEFLYWSFNENQFYFGAVTDNIELIANWKEITNETKYYTITFNTTGGELVDSQVIVEGGLVEYVETLRENYDFVYWMYNNQEYDFNTIVTNGITLVAKWQIHSYTVTFNSNGGSLIESQVIDMFSKATYCAPTQYDYIFLYWILDEQEFSFSTAITKDITLVAVWEKIARHEVTFDSDGGTFIDTQSIIKGENASIPYNPTKANYVFAYWMYEDEQFDFTTQITEDITLTAYWISLEKLVITFDSDGGSHVDSQIVNNLSYVTLPDNPTKENNDFIYWEYNGEQFKFNTQITESITLTARWYYVEPIVYYTATFMNNNAVYKTSVVIANQTVTSFNMSNTTDYRFSRWTYSNGETYNFTDVITNDVTLYANWDNRIYYDIIYDLDGGTFSNTRYVLFTAEAGYVPTQPTYYSNPLKDFHKFAHWELADGTKFYFGSNGELVTGDIYVYAIYEEFALDVTFNDLTVAFNGYSKSITISDNLPTGCSVTYENNGQIKAGVYTIYANIFYDGSIIKIYTATLTITALNLTVTVNGELQYEYDGDYIENNITISGSGWSSYDSTATRGTFYFTINKDLKEVGKYTATIRLCLTVDGQLVDNTNYILSKTSFEIEVIESRQYNFEYKIIDNEITITGFFNSIQKELILPETIDGLKVTSIEASAFYNYTSVETVVLPNNLTTIGYQAFRGCTNLSSITFGSFINTINTYAFYGCTSLTEVSLPSTMTSIEAYVFQSCTSLITVDLADSVKTIGNYAFNGCSALTNVQFGTSLQTIGNYAFNGCTKLNTLVLPDGLESIGIQSFYNNNALTDVILPDTIKSIGTHAFAECDYFNSVNIPRDLVTLSNYVFYNNQRMSIVTFHEYATLETIGTHVFYKTALLTLNLPDSLITINSTSFYQIAELTSLVIPSNVKTIGSSAFNGCTGLTSITISNGVQTIGSSAFSSCTKITSITIPDSVTSLGTSAFSSCTSLSSYKLPTNIEIIPSSIFSSCTGLTSITIPSTVTEIGSSAFSGCTNVENIIFVSSNTIKTIGDSAFASMKYMTSLTIPISVTTLGSSVFSGWTSLTSLTIPASTTKIGNSLFSGCTSLTSMVIPSTVETMGTSVFSGCTGLTNVTINSPITTLPGSTFSGCTSLKTIVLPIGLQVIGYQAFYNCKSMTSFVIPNTVTTIQYGAFRYCTGLTSIVIPENVTTVQYSSYSNYAFANTPDLTIYVYWEEGNRPSGWSSAWQNGCTIRYGYN